METTHSESAIPSASVRRSRSMRAKFLREVAAARLPAGPGPREPVTEASLASMPEVVKRYVRFMGVVGRARVWSFRARFTGVFRMKPDAPWLPVEAWQYDSGLEVTRIFHMRMRLAGVVPVYVRDTYVRGEARMLGRLLDTLSVVDVADDEVATSELVTYLNDAIFFAPSMVLGPEARWVPVDERSFDVSLTDHGRTVTARVFVDERGAPVDFSTTDRYGEDPAHPGSMVRARWSTPMREWTTWDGRPIPRGGTAVWHFPSGDFPYADFDFAGKDVELDVPPG
jgi:hypothetical protein